MTAELATYEQPTAELSTFAADPTGGRLVAWASGLAAAHRIGLALCETSFCPQHFRGKPDEAAAAILFGDEIGLTPTQALRSVHVISGTPGLYARTMVALVQSRGHEVWTEKESETEVVVCGKRRGSTKVERSAWTIERARKAGYTRNAKYQQTPQDMLYARAAATVCRRVAPDALAGLAFTIEELLLGDEDGATATTTEPSPKRTARRAALAPVAESEAADVPEPDPTPEPDPPAEPDEDPRDVPATRAQVVRLNILLKADLGTDDRDAKLSYLSTVCERDIASSSELSKAEASRIIDMLESPPLDDAAGGPDAE